jgi:hypothetical protein
MKTYAAPQGYRMPAPVGKWTDGRQLIFVAPGGTGVGTQADPAGTFDHTGVAGAPGAIIVMRGGTYNLAASLKINAGGTSEDPVTVMAYPGETVTVNGAGLGLLDSLIVGGGHVAILGKAITIANSSHSAVSIYGSGIDALVQDLTINDTQESAILVYDSMSGGTSKSNVRILRNTVRRAVKSAYASVVEGGWTQGLSIRNINSVIIEGNNIGQISGEGLDIIGCEYAKVLRNTVWDARSAGFYGDNPRFCEWRENLAYCTGDPEYFRDNRRLSGGKWIGDNPMAGIQLGREMPERLLAMEGNIIEDNVFRDTKSGITLTEYPAYLDPGGIPSRALNCIIRRNRVISNWSQFYNIYMYFPDRTGQPNYAPCSGNVIEDNIFVATAGGNQSTPTIPAGFTLSRNIWAGGVVTAAFRSADDSVSTSVPAVPADPSSPSTQYPDVPNSG